MPNPNHRKRTHSRASVLLLAVVGLLASAATVQAHSRSVSYSYWDLLEPGEYAVTVRVSRLELTRLGTDFGQLEGGSEALGAYLGEHLTLSSGGVACGRVGEARPRAATEGWLALRWRVRCPDPQAGDFEISSTILLDVAPSHLHFARVHIAQQASEISAVSASGPENTTRTFEKVLSDAATHWSFSTHGPDTPGGAEPPEGSTLSAYLALGIEHIVTGWDHLAFVVALLLLARSLGEVARLVTGFTLAHSVTLALAVLGLLRPDSASIEAVIGFSIALVAAENGWELGDRSRAIPLAIVFGLLAMLALALGGTGALSALCLAGLALFSFCHFGLMARVESPGRARTVLAFCFGLVHGFGFAGVLAEIALPADRLVPALLGFNLGVEIGQLGVVMLVWPLLRGLARLRDGVWYRVTCEVVSAAICGLGLYWFVLRTFEQG